jgi:uncharacterized protein YktB (UPF0637 family)
MEIEGTGGGPKMRGTSWTITKKKKSKQKFEFLLFCDDDAPLFLWLSLIYTNSPSNEKLELLFKKKKNVVEIFCGKNRSSMFWIDDSTSVIINFKNLSFKFRIKKKFNNCWCFPVKKKSFFFQSTSKVVHMQMTEGG